MGFRVIAIVGEDQQSIQFSFISLIMFLLSILSICLFKWELTKVNRLFLLRHILIESFSLSWSYDDQQGTYIQQKTNGDLQTALFLPLILFMHTNNQYNR